MTGPTTKERGDLAEDLACAFLQKRGLKIITRNYHCRHGEIDVVARERDTLCMVEVRSRGKGSSFQPEAGLGPIKLERLTMAANSFRSKYRLSKAPVRMDLVVVDWDAGNPEIRFYPGGLIKEMDR